MFNHEYDLGGISGDHPDYETFMNRPDVNSVLLSPEQKTRVPVFDTFVSVCPQNDATALSIIIPVAERLTIVPYLDHVIGSVEAPIRLQGSGIKDYPDVRASYINECREFGQPIIVLASGLWEDTDDAVVGLYFIPGISPQTAIKELKDLALLLSEEICSRN